MKKLKIELQFGSIAFPAITWFLLLCFLSEIFSRTTIVKNIGLYESYGSSHPQFDTQVVKIKSKFDQHKHIDCIFIGNSQVLTAVDPAIVEEFYLEQSGYPIRCQNFGLLGMEPVTAAPVARLLIKNFHPSLIILGTALFDYSAKDGGADYSIMSSAWVKYQLGYFSIDGWLFDNSYAYRYYLGLNQELSTRDTNLNPDGYLKFSNRTNETRETLVNTVHEKSKNIKFHKAQIDGLREVLSLNSRNVKIIVIEMPIDPVVFLLEKNIQNNYPDFRNLLENETKQAGVELWLTKDIVKIPENGWYDFIHQNDIGATYFSKYIGNLLAKTSLSSSVEVSPKLYKPSN